MTTTSDTQRRFAALYREKLELQDRELAVNKELESLQDPMMNFFADTGDTSKRTSAEAAGPLIGLLRDIAACPDFVSFPRDIQVDVREALNPRPLTLYVETTLWANAKSGMQVEACEALREHGFEDFVSPSFNVQTLSARAREMQRTGEEWPAAILETIDVKPKVKIKARRA